MIEMNDGIISSIQHVFIIGAKSIGQYGGYETFVDGLIVQHQNELSIKYHIACKGNGDGCMDETELDHIEVLKRNVYGSVTEFTYHNAHVFKIHCPNIGPAVAIYYDYEASKYSIQYCKDNHIEHPIFYFLSCRIGLFINFFRREINAIGGKYYLNPDGHEWKREKWSKPVRHYWKWSEKKMVKAADIVVCDSVNIEEYIKKEFKNVNTTYIAYGADITPSSLSDSNVKFVNWLRERGLEIDQYFLIVGRFVPENNYETMIRECMESNSKRNFVFVTNVNKKFLAKLQRKLAFKNDSRIQFVGTVYDKELLKKIRECAYGYLHGHEVGGTNPSLLEALGLTDLNLLLDVGFNREVAQDAAFYWKKGYGDLAKLINRVDCMDSMRRIEYGCRAKERIKSAYSWIFIADEYKKLWLRPW